jgi:predicted Zn finger-like uncharacterized protein
MNLRCPRCHTLYFVAPERVPATALRAQCGRCDEIFPIPHLEAAISPLPLEEAPVAPPAEIVAEAHEPALAEELMAALSPEPVEEAEALAFTAEAFEAEATAPAAPPRAHEPIALPEPAPTPAPAPTVRFFGPQDPHARAQRIARALVSDIVAYHPERRDRSLAAGSLQDDFRDEILKSWEEFVLQVGSEMARETTYFRDALNDILAQGEAVF